MNVNAYLQSGVIESYCLGFTSSEEDGSVMELAAQYPAIQHQIELVRTSFESILMQPVLEPAALIKKAVLKRLVKQESLSDLNTL